MHAEMTNMETAAAPQVISGWGKGISAGRSRDITGFPGTEGE